MRDVAALPPALTGDETARELVVPLAPWTAALGGLREQEGMLEAVSASGRVAGRVPLAPNWDWSEEVSDYRVCDRFPEVLWCIGQPFSQRVRILVEWKQNGIECSGELELPDLTKLPFGWEVLVCSDSSLKAAGLVGEIPFYLFDVAFPWRRLHDERDIVLRRRLAEAIGRFVCEERGRFKVSRRQSREVVVNNWFTGRPTTANRPPLVGLWPDLFRARAAGARM